MAADSQHLQELYALFATVVDREEARKLLHDLLTPQELQSLAERWQIVKALDQGMTQREIAKKLGISISKITRGSRALQYGSGGLRHFLRKATAPAS